MQKNRAVLLALLAIVAVGGSSTLAQAEDSGAGEMTLSETPQGSIACNLMGETPKPTMYDEHGQPVAGSPN